LSTHPDSGEFRAKIANPQTSKGRHHLLAAVALKLMKSVNRSSGKGLGRGISER
jgi:hypothetical protein